MQRKSHVVVVLVLSLFGRGVGQDQDPIAQLRQMLQSHFTVTKLAPNQMDIVTAGSVMVLHKDGVLMCSVSVPGGVSYAATSTYKDRAVSHSIEPSDAPKAMPNGLRYVQPRANCGRAPSRTAMSGDKYWITKAYVDMGNDRVVFRLYSDPYDDVRYWGELQVLFPKGSIPTPDQLLNTISEVLTVQSDDAAAAQPQPAPQPKTVLKGDSIDQVVATLGKPEKILQVDTKQIYVYKALKITFLDGKVSDIQ